MAACRWSLFGNKTSQVLPANYALQKHIDTKFESLSKDMQSLREEVQRLTKVNAEMKDVMVPSLEGMGMKVEEMNKTVCKAASRPAPLNLTQDNVRKHTDSQEQEVRRLQSAECRVRSVECGERAARSEERGPTNIPPVSSPLYPPPPCPPPPRLSSRSTPRSAAPSRWLW